MASRKKAPPVYPPVAVQLRRRTRLRYSIFIAMGLLTMVVVLDHAGCFGYRGDDGARFDRRAVRVLAVIEADIVSVRTTDTSRETIVQLIGVDAPHGDSGTGARAYALEHLQGRTLTLRLDPLARRDAAGHLPAYLYLTDGDVFNIDLVRDGLAYADRRVGHTLRAPMEGAESDARRHLRGLWNTVTEPQMPEWRRQWLKEMRERHRTVQ